MVGMIGIWSMVIVWLLLSCELRLECCLFLVSITVSSYTSSTTLDVRLIGGGWLIVVVVITSLTSLWLTSVLGELKDVLFRII